MKKLIYASMLIFALAISFAGCSDKKETDTGEQAKKEQAQKSEKSLEELKEEMKQLVSKRSLGEGIYYEYAVTVEGGSGMPESSMTMNTWQQGENIRTETLDQSGQVMSVLIKEAGEDYILMYNPAENIAIRQDIASSESMQDDYDINTSSDDVNWDGVVEIKDDDVDGRNAKLVVLKDESTGQNIISRMWIDEKTGLVIKSEIEADGKVISTMKIKNIKEGSFGEDTFKLPDDVEVMKIEDMMPSQP
ncbi:hypothetical protein EAL2_c02720 [Peptoclostridium acidaminophilum DSM 3953]|uniref:Outer membrane lipoprotein-sorting protein n=1 Tax=Peptoclostridium acidaminophilum DSM 3953 TaxID=1286171 RepID=W8T430_PEPAC|nr:hypothetical protein [Peptoclostridium acidaminophilum]AHM55575.1 hypothetical protein EAL2_c02720 [Peptoclostridium acidaminophilum DSM 3953]